MFYVYCSFSFVNFFIFGKKNILDKNSTKLSVIIKKNFVFVLFSEEENLRFTHHSYKMHICNLLYSFFLFL